MPAGETPIPAPSRDRDLPAGQGNHGAASLESITSSSKNQMRVLDPSNLDLGQEEEGKSFEGEVAPHSWTQGGTLGVRGVQHQLHAATFSLDPHFSVSY